MLRTYKPLDTPQPPLPPGTGIVNIERQDGAWWHPVFLVDASDLAMFDLFRDPFGSRLYLAFKGEKGRRQAIGYLWRRHRRGDLEYSRHFHKVAERSCRLDYCAAGVTGNLYQYQSVTVAEAAERLMVPKRWILKLIKEGKVKARLHTQKHRSRGYTFFTNYYLLNLAYLEAYIDRCGYKNIIPSMAEKQRQLAPRQLPRTIWCV